MEFDERVPISMGFRESHDFSGKVAKFQKFQQDLYNSITNAVNAQTVTIPWSRGGIVLETLIFL